MSISAKHEKYYKTLETIRESGSHNMYSRESTEELVDYHPELTFDQAREIQYTWMNNYKIIKEKYLL